jgi:hypothetical protein
VKRIPLILYFFLVAGCGTGPGEKKAIYNNYEFDKQVIEKLPVYDSLVFAIIKNAPSFQRYIKDNDSYRAYRYLIASDSNELFKKLPAEEATRINQFNALLGKNFIRGFDLFKDSSIRIDIRKHISEKDQVEILENLSYYPPGANIRRREFPVKDTILNKNWQYWIEFVARDPF